MNIKKALTIILVIFLPFSLFAQEKANNNSLLKGIWTLQKTKNGHGNIVDVPIGTFKLFDSDGTFSNMRITPSGSILTHQGYFEINGDDVYTETIQEQTEAITSQTLNTKQTHLKYKLSEDSNTLIIEGELLINDSQYRFMLHEVWEKVNLYKD